MSDGADRDQPPSAKRRDEFAKRGDVAQSRELLGSLVLLAGAYAITKMGATMINLGLTAMRQCLGDVGRPLDSGLISIIGQPYMRTAVPISVFAAGAAAIGGFLLHRGSPPYHSPSFNIGKINPAKKLGQLFSLKQMATMLGTSFIKIIGLSIILWVTLAGPFGAFVTKVPASLALGLRDAGITMDKVMWRSLTALVGCGVIDWLLSWWRLEKQMKMSLQELREESKNENADPRMKGKRRRMGQELIRSLSVKDVQNADVILVNPTHVAVALLYKDKTSSPKVVAKGADGLAERIRTIARRAQVPIVSQPPLARLLYAKVKVGKHIPAETWQAVAVVLAHVYRLKKRS